MNKHDLKIIQAVFIMYDDQYYIFQIENREDILFSAINRNVLKEYNLHSVEYIGSKFEITYSESFSDDLEDEFEDQDDFNLTIESLKLIK